MTQKVQVFFPAASLQKLSNRNQGLQKISAINVGPIYTAVNLYHDGCAREIKRSFVICVNLNFCEWLVIRSVVEEEDVIIDRQCKITFLCLSSTWTEQKFWYVSI